MPRPKNDKLKNRIRSIAWEQFRDRGYNGTSYTSIAEACGISRNLLQYHFPKKEILAIDFMERLLECCEKAVRAEGSEPANLVQSSQEAFDVGCCYYAFLLNRGYSRFLLEIIADRELTRKILAFDTSWTIRHFGFSESSLNDQKTVTRNVIMHTGGFYELLYYSLQNDEPFDIADNLAYAMRSVVEGFGVTPDDSAQIFDGRIRGLELAESLEIDN